MTPNLSSNSVNLTRRRWRVLLTGRLPDELVFEARSLLGENIELVYEPAHPGWTDERLAPLLKNIDAVLAGGDEYSKHVLTSARDLRVIARLGVGFDRVDLEEASKLGIYVTTTPGANASAVADLVFGLLISLARQIPTRSLALRDGLWEPAMGFELAELQLGLIGYGAIGAIVAARARTFGMEVNAFDALVGRDQLVADGVGPVSLDEVFRMSKVLSLHVPSLPETYRLVNASRLAIMPEGSFLLNTARGDLIDEVAVLEALESGHLAGAGLDVFASEPPTGVSQILASHPSVIATPHLGGSTRLSNRRILRLAVESVLEGLAGRRPPRVINL